MNPAGRLHQLTADQADAGQRLDRFLAGRLPERSRSELARWIRNGAVTVGGDIARPSHRIQAGDEVGVAEPLPEETNLTPEAIPLDILYEEPQFIALVKPAGLVVHPGAGVRSGTLVNALLALGQDWSTIGGVKRPGIVHRLDRDTSGVMVVARTDAAHRALSCQFRDRTAMKEYLAVVWGTPRPPRGCIRAPIGRSRSRRGKMAIRDAGRAAETLYELSEDYGGLSLLLLRPHTGRTHQIRVHLSALGHPVVGDPLYGGAERVRGLLPGARRQAIQRFGRLALHAFRLGLAHPDDGRPLRFEAPPPGDFEELLRALRQTA